ncbi:hypothetical protein HDU85_000903 [Gaertneriomyces sp. JEL0708]|nr:hypothetical protein HDU85_000903 [Gaertneriomyces sp. JEL0708]
MTTHQQQQQQQHAGQQPPQPQGTLLSDPPTDGISSLDFHPSHPSLLLVASWDKTTRLYDVDANTTHLVQTFSHPAPVLDVAFSSHHNTLFSAGLDAKLRSSDYSVESPSTTTTNVIGSHDEPIRCVQYATQTSQVITGSWDMTVGLWDPRQNTSLGKFKQPAKVFSLDVVDYSLVVAMAGRSIYIYDIRNMKETMQRRESTLKFMTRSVKCMSDAKGFVTASIEGRVAVNYFDPEVEREKKYAFKCHRGVGENGQEMIYPVNSLSFHPVYGTFASGGADGVVNIWDSTNRKRLKQYTGYVNGVAAVSFNCDGRYLAVADSYTYEQGPKR